MDKRVRLLNIDILSITRDELLKKLKKEYLLLLMLII